MKKRLSIMLLMAVTVLLPVMAQQVQVTSVSRMRDGLPTVQGGFYPVLNPSGDHLLFQTDGAGMKMCDMASGQVTTITMEYVAGNDACWGGDGKVYFVTQQAGDDKLVYRSGMCYDPATDQTTVVTEPQHGAVRAISATRGAAMKGPGRDFKSSGNIGSAAWTEGNRVHVLVGTEERVFSPVDSWAGYLWASLSPDGKRVAFFAAGKGVVIIDLRGQMLAMLGNYEMPCWYNNDYLVAQNAKDDGHQFTSSQIVLLKADGTWRAELTQPESMTMHPTCGGGKIVYTTIDGLLHEMKINIYD